MRHYLKLLVVLISSLFMVSYVFANETSLDTENKKQSYSMGTVIGKQIVNSIKQDQLNIHHKAFSDGVVDVLQDKKLKLSNDEIQNHLLKFSQNQSNSYNLQVANNAKSHLNELLDTQDIPEIGNPKAKIVVVEFFDYNCAHCKLMSPVLKNLVKNNKDLKILLRNYPILGSNSNYAARAVLWSKESKNNKQIELHHDLLSNSEIIKKQDVKDALKKSGLDPKKFDSENNSLKIKKLIENNFKLASELGIKGTPSLFFINKDTKQIKFISGAVTNDKELQKIVDELK